MKKTNSNCSTPNRIFRLLLVLSFVACLVLPMTKESFADSVDTIPHGVSMDGIDLEGKTKDELIAIANERLRILGELSLDISSSNSEVSVQLKDLGLTWSNEADIIASAFVKTTKGSLISQYKSKKDLENSSLVLNMETKVNKDLLVAFLLNHVSDLNTEPINATVTRYGGQFKIVDGVQGMKVDLDETYEKIVSEIQYLNGKRLGSSLKVTVVGHTEEPEVKADAFANFGSLLGEYSTSYTTTDKGRTINVTLATSKFNGTIVYPGEQLSALSIMNPVTAEGGYQEAATYTAGGVEDKVGGGICQVATTLYNAVLNAELTVDYRKPHSRVASYVPYAADAMVYAAQNSDFIFTNSTDYPIYIESFVDNSKSTGTMTFRIYGVETRPANRTFEFESQLLSYIIPAEGADPSEYFTLIPDESMVAFADVKSEEDVYAEYLSVFYPVIKAALYKNVYIDGVQTEHILINVSTYKNRINNYIAGSFRVNPDTYIREIKYNVETRELTIGWWSHRWDEEATKEETTLAPTEKTTQTPTTQASATEAPATEAPATEAPPTEASGDREDDE